MKKRAIGTLISKCVALAIVSGALAISTSTKIVAEAVCTSIVSGMSGRIVDACNACTQRLINCRAEVLRGPSSAYPLRYLNCLSSEQACNDAADLLSQSPDSDRALEKKEGTDKAGGDPSTFNVSCEDGSQRGAKVGCVITGGPDSNPNDLNFRLNIGPRIVAGSPFITCQSGNYASFYPNGRIESCTIGRMSPEGSEVGLSDVSNAPKFAHTALKWNSTPMAMSYHAEDANFETWAPTRWVVRRNTNPTCQKSR